MRPALNRALEYLRGCIAEARAGRRPRRLAPLAALAARAGVSHVSMLKAVHELRDSGALAVSHRYGTRVVDGGGVPPPATPHSPPPPRDTLPAWKRAAGAIRDDCERGVYAAGDVLPPYKALAARYGVSHVTIAAALRALCRDGELERVGRGFRRSLPVLPRAASTIVLFARGRDASEPLLSTHLDREEFLALEQECRRHGVVLHPVLWYFARPNRAEGTRDLERFLRSCGPRTILGCIVWDRLLPDPLHTELEALLDTHGLAYAVLVSSGAPPGSSRWDPAHTFHMGGRSDDGRVVGEYLYALGHRRVAYVHPLGRPEWSPPRAAGIREAFARHGGQAELIETELLAGERGEPLAGELRQRLARVRAEIERLSRQAPVRGELDPHLRLLDRLASDIGYLQTSMELRTYLFPLCDRLIRLPGVTAWVGANDMVALGCLDYLRQRRIAVPERISVVGFDDSEAAMARQMSSYNFNVPAYAQAMVRRLIQRQGPQHSQPGPVQIDGYVQARATTGPAGVRTP